jgi:hypothetical protein
MSRRGSDDVPLSTGKANSLVCVPGGGYTTWTFEPRGDAYVSAFTTYHLYYSLTRRNRIGNAVDATAIHRNGRIQGQQSVSRFISKFRAVG